MTPPRKPLAEMIVRVQRLWNYLNDLRNSWPDGTVGRHEAQERLDTMDAVLATLRGLETAKEERRMTTPQDRRSMGLIDKFRVERTDGTSAPGQKHDGCKYFVLDLTHDPHAIPALAAYARSCARDYPVLSEDLRAIVKNHKQIEAVGRALDTERFEKR